MSELECPICFEPYDTGLRAPMIVPCGGMHGLCTSCVAMLKMDDSAEFKCPQCRETIENTARINQNRGLMAALQALEKKEAVAVEARQPVERTPDAVTEKPVPPLPKPTGGVPCARCERTLPKSAFSGAQLKKKAGRKCSECVFGATGAPAPAPAPSSLESEATSDEAAPLPEARVQRHEQIVARRERSIDEQCARALALQLMSEAEIDRLTDDIATGTLTETGASQRINALMMRRMHAAFAGKRVRIHGLVRREDLNGRCGRVQGATNSDERFCILLEAPTAGGETMVSVGTQNLELVTEESPAEPERAEFRGESLVVDLDGNLPELAGDFGELERRCTECGHAPADPAQLKRCGQCKLTRYCSRECQRSGWVRGGHRTSCGCQAAWPSKQAIEQGTAPQVLAALSEFGSACPQLAAACLFRFGPLNMCPEAVRRHWATTFGPPGVVAIERAYAAHASFPGVVVLASGALMLLCELVGVAALIRGSLVKLMVESLTRDFPPPPSGWPANALIATNALTLLKNLFMEQDYAQVERVKEQLIAAGGVPALCKALKSFPHHKVTQMHGMQVLFFTTANRYDAKEQAAANDAPRLCVQALRAYGVGTSNAAQMCHDGVGALRNINVGEDEPGVARKLQSLRAGAARAIYDALATLVSDDEVPLVCISALLNLFHRKTASQLHSTLPDGIDGVVKLVVRALRASEENEELHMFGVSAMNTFTIHCERERLTRVAVSLGAVETMVSMMSRFPQHETILDGCCLTLDGWLQALCPLESTRSGEEEFVRFFEAGVLEACLRALRTFRGLSSAVELFRRILHTYRTGRYSSEEAFVEEMSQLCTNIGGAQQWLSDVMADVTAGSAAQ